MERSDSIKELVTALAKAQGEISKAKKDVNNIFFKSKYADLASVTDAIKEPLSKNGLSYTQVMHDAEHAVCIETFIFHNSGEWMSTGKLTVPVSKLDAQGFGSALTYTRRYSLSAAFGVAPEEDDGNAASAAKPIPNSAKSVSKDVLDKMPPEEQEFLQGIYAKAREFLDSADALAALKYLRDQKLDTDEQVAINAMFSAPHRKAIKDAAALQKEKFDALAAAKDAEELLNTP